MNRQVADALHVLGRCVQQAHGPPEEAEEYFRRALHLKIAVQSRKDCDEDPQVSLRGTLQMLGSRQREGCSS